MNERAERIERIAYKIRKTVPINTGTKVERDKTKYDKGQRKQWKHELKKYESREELALDLLRKGHSMNEAVLIAASVKEVPEMNREARIAERVLRRV